ncbi:MAG: hypothetical protein JO256_11905 [Alphaproteobacteria bacterium]|nr:hypothetical protein [Alphaproteobacteria bacterium]
MAIWISPALAQDADITLNGVIDMHVHQGPDSGGPREIDADDLARLARQMGERGLVMKNHWESTSAMVYIVRKEVPGIELFGGVTQDLAVGGINLAAVKQMADVAGHFGKVVWLPTYDSEISVRHADGKGEGAFVPIQKDGKLLASVLELFDFIGQHQLVLATGHISAQEVLMVIPEARRHGVEHIVVTHAMSGPTSMTVPQMQQAARDGALIEFVYGATLGPGARLSVRQYAEAIRAIGARNCILSTDLGGTPRPFARPLPPQGMLDFMNALHREGLSVADINMMAKTNPAMLLGLKS